MLSDEPKGWSFCYILDFHSVWKGFSTHTIKSYDKAYVPMNSFFFCIAQSSPTTWLSSGQHNWVVLGK